ncbi:MAG: alpha-D-ribose 1-methylphosphonate 5-triphosphate synthase subunit PhnH, partial [Glaciecola sp.]
TLVVAVDGFTSGVLFALTGPGVDGVTHLHVTGLGEDMVAALMHSRTDYPAGVDLVLVAGRQLVGLPRSTQITRRHDTKGA